MDDDELAEEIARGEARERAAARNAAKTDVATPAEGEGASAAKASADDGESDGDGSADAAEPPSTERGFGAPPSGERASAAPVARPRAGSARTSSGGIPAWLTIGAVLLLLSGGVSVLLWGTSASDAFVYSKLVNEVMENPQEFHDRELRVEGQLQEGSVVFENQPSCEHRFVLEREGYTMPVRFPRCVVPDTFRDDMPMDVVVQGQLQTDGTFLANEVIPRCPSKYEMRERQQNGEDMPHAAPTSPS